MARKKEILFCDYFEEWIEIYKSGAIAAVTLNKYYTAAKVLREICPRLFLSDFDRSEYQRIINEYAKTHEKQTTIDFHHIVKGCIKDLFYDGLLEKDPTYKVVLKGKEPTHKKKSKFLQVNELKKLVGSLNLTNKVNRDWMLLLIAKTGIRYAEALALTPKDFDWNNNTLTIDKTWDYKTTQGGFKHTKTESSVRTIVVDWQIVGQFKPLIQNLNENEPIFVEKERDRYKRQFNSTLNNYLSVKCKELNITEITCHALRHTHASILLAEGVSIHTISARLGHADVGVTQTTYAHVLDELQKKDDQKMMSVLMQIA